ncbi:sigma factor-like helix-turn-helix DNA-binding protein [Streptosporangium subroseum]|uniref:sigma factor-like helix-turn-helix DNA-binding protein n=1 Tax=Streptosporangium subroseum TaxID=106412 RepID=UPI00343A9C07
MTRRRRPLNDPVSRLATDEGQLFASILETLPQRELDAVCMAFGITTDTPMSVWEIGKVYDIRNREVVRILDRALRMLRHPSRSAVLRVLEEGKAVDVIDVWRMPKTSAVEMNASQAADIIWCGHCRERQFASHNPSTGGGRPRKYCSNRCRQAAYRTRRTRPDSP